MSATRVIVIAFLAATPAARGANLAGRTVPAPLYGVTLDRVTHAETEFASLTQIVHMPTVRVVFDRGTPADAYVAPITEFRSAAYIMGELADSSYMHAYTVASITRMTKAYTATLAGLVDIWEIGNEVNGNWLGSNTLAKVEAMYDIVTSRSGITALTFFYEGEPGDPHNCISRQHGGNDMFTWITDAFQLNLPPNQRPAETEKIRLGVNYALVSWYPSQCPGEHPNWARVYTSLAGIFPNAQVGFGELGTPHPQGGSKYEVKEIDTYYPLGGTLQGLPASYIGGYFWWYFAEEMVPWSKTILGPTLNGALQ